MKMSIHKLFQFIRQTRFLKYFLGSLPLLTAILFVFMIPSRLATSDFTMIAWTPGQELLATGSVSANYPYPVWTALLMLPFSVWPVQVGMALWAICNLLMLAASLAIFFILFGAEISPFLFILVVSVSGAFMPVLTSVWLGQLSIFLLFILVLAAYLFINKRWTWLGIILGLSFLKPQVMILLVFLVLLWALWHRLWQTLFGFLGTIALFTLISLPFISSPGQLIGGGIGSHLATYISQTSTIWGLFLTLGIPWFVSAIISTALLGWLGWVWWPFLRGKEMSFNQVLSLFSAAILVNLITVPYSWMHNLTLLLLPLGYCLILADKLKGKARIYWLALLLIIMHPLMLGVFIALNGPAHTQAYQIIPALVLVPTMLFLEYQISRSPGLVGGNVP
jgi:hypothetical protein